MALNIKSDEADQLARELARRRGQSITTVVVEALKAELSREKRRARSPGLTARLLQIGEEYSRLPVLAGGEGERSDDDVLGFDDMVK